MSRYWARYYQGMSMTVSFTLGELLAKLRKDAGFDQAEIARRIGVARNSISNYETGRSVPGFDVVVRWAAVTGASLDWLASMCTPWDLNPEPTDYGLDAAFWQLVDSLQRVA